jgi:hypothetical protein
MKKILITILFSIMVPLPAHAATFHFSSLQNIPRGGEGIVTLSVDTKGDKINAISGEIVVPEGVEIKKIVTGGSIIVLWVEQPTLSLNKITFSGMTPGGFDGDRELFSLVVKPLVVYPLPLTFSLLEAYRNDNEGTKAVANGQTFVLRPSTSAGTSVVFDDQTPPEAFTPLIASDVSLFDGEPFVSFVAQDKGVGIAQYEWASSYIFSPSEDDWKPAENPLLLSHSLLWQKIYIRATDALGNSTVASVASFRHYALLWFGVILIVLVLCVLFSFARPSSYRSS